MEEINNDNLRFAGIGKSFLGASRPNYVDLESTPFEKDWDRYIKVAKHMSDQGYYAIRGNTKGFIELIEKKWEKFTNAFEWGKGKGFKTGEYLGDIIGLCLKSI